MLDEVFEAVEKFAKTKIDEIIKLLPKAVSDFINLFPEKLQKKWTFRGIFQG